MLLGFCVQNSVADEPEVYVFVIAHLVTVAVELHNEFLIAAIVPVRLHFFWSFVQKENDG